MQTACFRRHVSEWRRYTKSACKSASAKHATTLTSYRRERTSERGEADSINLLLLAVPSWRRYLLSVYKSMQRNMADSRSVARLRTIHKRKLCIKARSLATTMYHEIQLFPCSRQAWLWAGLFNPSGSTQQYMLSAWKWDICLRALYTCSDWPIVVVRGSCSQRIGFFIENSISTSSARGRENPTFKYQRRSTSFNSP